MERKVLPLPDGVDLFPDLRSGERTLRISWHEDGELLVVSVWRHGVCVGTVRLTRSEALRLLGSLAAGLSESDPTRDVTRAG